MPDANGRIALAEFEMTVTGPPGTRVDFIPSPLGTPASAFEGFVLTNGQPIDINVSTESGVVTIDGVVPEPGSILIWAGLIGAPILVRRRRQHASKVLPV